MQPRRHGRADRRRTDVLPAFPRYRPAGGAENVSFEGIRCEEHTWKLYATGSTDGQWRTARISEWRPIENKSVNRYHAALSKELFCPVGNPIATADEGRRALQLGKNPNAK